MAGIDNPFSRERWSRVEELLALVLDLPPAQRDARLDAECADDPDLRQQVATLVDAAERPGRVDRTSALVNEWLSDLDAPDLQAGEAIGPYVVIEPIGAGGMGEVYRARDPKLGRDVAIKLLSDDAAPSDRRRFQREAQAASSLNHPHILTVHDASEADGRQYLVTEFVDGGTLRQWAAAEPRTWREIVELLVGVADGLAAAHAAGILHRDVKPENILVTSTGYAKLADFGAARMAGDARHGSAAPRVTRTGVMVGTIPYMSPEQALGAPLDARTDIFSFGIVLYEMLCGRKPFAAANDVDLLHAIAHDAPPPLDHGIPSGLHRCVEKMLAKDPADRYSSMRDAIVDLRGLIRTVGDTRPSIVPAAAPSVLNMAAAQARRRRAVLTAAALLFVAVAGGIAWWVDRAGETGARNAPTVSSAPKTIAVLPIAGVAADQDQEDLADGVTSELISTLRRIPDLQVTEVVSSFHFKGRSDDLTAIAEQLGVQYLLPVSARRAHGRLLVTAELIEPATGVALWSGRRSYEEHELADIFDVQDEIARNVASALEVTLGVGASRLPGRTKNWEAFGEWSKAFAMWYDGRRETNQQALVHARKAIQLDPSYIPPRSVLYNIYRDSASIYPDRAAEFMSLSTKVLDEARLLAPDDPLVRSLDAYSAAIQGNWMPSGALLNDPSVEPASLGHVPMEGLFLLGVGRGKEAVHSLEAARDRDPYNLAIPQWLSAAYGVVGNFKAAAEESERGLKLNPDSLLLRGGRLVRALDTRDPQQIKERLAESRLAGVPAHAPSMVLGALLDRPDEALANIRQMAATRPGNTRLQYIEYALWAAYYDDPELALEMSKNTIGSGNVALWWSPLFRDVRRLQAFKDFARDNGYVDYWRTYGWATDFCRPTADDDFECT
jgi:serine/threonine-protein kinase